MQKSKTIGGYNKNVVMLGLVSLFTDFSNEVILRTIPLFLANVLGVKISVIGFIEGTAESVSTLLKVVSGRWSDLTGKRKPLTVMGYGLSSLSKPFLYFASTWTGVFLVRFVDRVGKGIRTAPRDALIADSSPAVEMGKSFGLHRTLDPLGAVLGTALAGLMVYWHEKQALQLNQTTFRYLVLFSLIPAAISLVLLIAAVKEPQKDSTGEKPDTDKANQNNDGINAVKAGAGKVKLYQKSFFAFLAVNVVFTLGNSSDAFLILKAQKTGVTLAGIFFLLAVFNVVASVLSLPAGRLSDKFGRKKVLVFGWVTYALVYFGFAYIKTPLQVWLLYSLYGAYYGLTDGVARALVADTVDAGRRGAAYGLYNMAIGISALPASFLAGVLWDKFGASAPFIFGAVLAITAAFGLLLAVEETSPRALGPR